jgi:hypothetical protein
MLLDIRATRAILARSGATTESSAEALRAQTG